jgi:hypothetical protein
MADFRVITDSTGKIISIVEDVGFGKSLLGFLIISLIGGSLFFSVVLAWIWKVFENPGIALTVGIIGLLYPLLNNSYSDFSFDLVLSFLSNFLLMTLAFGFFIDIREGDLIEFMNSGDSWGQIKYGLLYIPFVLISSGIATAVVKGINIYIQGVYDNNKIK